MAFASSIDSKHCAFFRKRKAETLGSRLAADHRNFPPKRSELRLQDSSAKAEEVIQYLDRRYLKHFKTKKGTVFFFVNWSYESKPQGPCISLGRILVANQSMSRKSNPVEFSPQGNPSLHETMADFIEQASSPLLSLQGHQNQINQYDLLRQVQALLKSVSAEVGTLLVVLLFKCLQPGPIYGMPVAPGWRSLCAPVFPFWQCCKLSTVNILPFEGRHPQVTTSLNFCKMMISNSWIFRPLGVLALAKESQRQQGQAWWCTHTANLRQFVTICEQFCGCRHRRNLNHQLQPSKRLRVFLRRV